jgi:hypothetical protein
MIQSKSLRLLECLFNIEFDDFLHSNQIQLSKQSKMDDCQNEVIFFMESRPNSIFIIMNSEKAKDSSMTIIMSNIEEINDHLKQFIITISESCETFKVERKSEFPEGKNQLIRDFERSKI